MQPATGIVWVGMFAAGGIGGAAVSAVHACPARDQLCVVADGLAFLVNVLSPTVGATVVALPVMDVVASDEPPLLLVVTFDAVTAIGPEGIAWTTGRIALDGLRVERVSGHRVQLRADNVEGGADALTLDAITGQQIEGRRFRDLWPPDALA